MNISFTGTRTLCEGDRRVIAALIATLDPTDTLIVGGCIGTDALVARLGMARGHPVHVVLPADHRQIDPEWATYSTSHEQLPPSPEPYRARNRRLVALADYMIAFAEQPEDHGRSRRSGTWMTIRLAIAAGKPLDVYILTEMRP